ncbi:MAG: hypothetical protein ABI862_18880 [Ilumatobacteraceae bacterium]
MRLRGLLPVIVLGLAACGSDSAGSAPTVSSADESTSLASATSEAATTTATTPLSLTFTLEGVENLTPTDEPQMTRSSNDETRSVWSTTTGITDAFIVLHDGPAPQSTSPEGDVSAVPMDVPNGTAWLVTDIYPSGESVPPSATRVMWWRSDGRLWVVSNFGLTPERLVELTLAIQPGSGLPFVLADPGMTFVGLSSLASFESARQDWTLDGSSVVIAVTNGGLAQQLDVPIVSVAARTVSGSAGYEITLPNGQLNVIWPTDDPDRWASLLVGPLLTSRVNEIASAIASR